MGIFKVADGSQVWLRGPEALRPIGGSDDDELVRSRAYEGLAGVRRLERVCGRREDSVHVVRHAAGSEAERDCDVARHAQAIYGAERVAIVDFDVHHGNGTQHIFWDDKTIMYASTHEMPLFPGTGEMGERGEHDQIVNAPLRAGPDPTEAVPAEPWRRRTPRDG